MKDNLCPPCTPDLVERITAKAKYLKYKIDHVKEDESLIDYKTIFQEYTQKEFKKIPEYCVIDETGPDHSKSFKVVVKLKEKIVRAIRKLVFGFSIAWGVLFGLILIFAKKEFLMSLLAYIILLKI